MAHTPLRIIPLGGLGEVGKNMLALEYGDDILVIDCGVLFPEADMPGIDLVIPDVSYLVEQRHKIKALLITHGHEDHTGALPYVLPKLDVPVYAPRLAHGLIQVKLREHKALNGAQLKVVEPGETLKLGKLRVEFFRVCHSIPDAMGLAIHTLVGTVVHTGDFKVDHTPVDGKTTDLAKLAQLGADGVLLLMSDSTYSELPGYTPSEQVVGRELDRVMGEAPGRVLITTFASLISRMQQTIDAAVHHGRKVAIVGRSMSENAAMAQKMGYLKAPEGTLINVNQAKGMPPQRVVLLTTGSQGEPTSALVRIANKNHSDITVIPGDTVVISASPIPGNESLIGKTIDNLFRQGARVLYSRVAMVHVHGHASQEELKIMLNLVRPQYFVPVHGEYRHLVTHGHLARLVGIPDERIFILENGDVLEVTSSGAKIAGRVKAGPVFIDGSHMWESDSAVIRDRRTLAQDGFVVITVALDKERGRPVGKPEVVSAGFIEPSESKELFRRVSAAVLEALSRDGSAPADWGSTSAKVKEIASKLLYSDTGRRPIIVPVALEV